MTAVRVNEFPVLTYTPAATAEWWARFRQLMPGRITTVEVGYPGDIVDVACNDRAHAEWFIGHMADRGIPRSALRIVATQQAAA